MSEEGRAKRLLKSFWVTSDKQSQSQESEQQGQEQQQPRSGLLSGLWPSKPADQGSPQQQQQQPQKRRSYSLGGFWGSASAVVTSMTEGVLGADEEDEAPEAQREGGAAQQPAAEEVAADRGLLDGILDSASAAAAVATEMVSSVMEGDPEMPGSAEAILSEIIGTASAVVNSVAEAAEEALAELEHEADEEDGSLSVDLEVEQI